MVSEWNVIKKNIPIALCSINTLDKYNGNEHAEYPLFRPHDWLENGGRRNEDFDNFWRHLNNEHILSISNRLVGKGVWLIIWSRKHHPSFN